MPSLGHGLDERPIISRLNSFDNPIVLRGAGMIFAGETCYPATDGVSAARIEKEVVGTPSSARIITVFPAEDLPIPNRWWRHAPLPRAEGRARPSA